MANFNFRDNLSPNKIALSQNVALPAVGGTDLFTAVTMVGNADRIGAMEIHFSATVGGTLKLKRIVNGVTSYETLNGGVAVTANVPIPVEVRPFAAGEVISLTYTGTGGTYYLTVADVSGEIVRPAT